MPDEENTPTNQTPADSTKDIVKPPTDIHIQNSKHLREIIIPNDLPKSKPEEGKDNK